ncbi:BFH_HP2_G0023230.mRNA.1.CDS.1 [Saccharomyces cerevisiae]|nr:BFH_HP2_G0023230.mRNA.1.CDS.1 [Saccharomyces cerevisiae]CAI6550443.1 BFH_HP2_G0023230.mRNA.1.CDS.1 [Saccharomyces cerevisiae]CAI6559351.1 BFH_HP1_G0023450.mRNA.1.CDS.1 [Saccharomyces cerevisiae]
MSARLSYGASLASIPRCFDLKSSKITVMGDDHYGKTSLVRSWLGSSFQISDANRYRVSDLYHKTIQFDTFVKYYRTFGVKGQLPNYVDLKAKNSGTIYKSCGNFLEERLINANKLTAQRRTSIDVQVFDTNRMEVSYLSELTTLQIKQSDAIILCFDSTNDSSFASLESYICIIHHSWVSRQAILDYFETSSKFNVNVEDLFLAVLLKIEKSKSDRRKLLQGFISKMYPLENSPLLRDKGKTGVIETGGGGNTSFESHSVTTTLDEPKKPTTKKGEQTPTKTCLAKNATTRRSNESPSNDEKKKIKKGIIACCLM